MPSIRRLDEAIRGSAFTIIAVNVGEGALRVRTAVERLEIPFTVVLDSESTALERWHLSALPTTFVLDRDGLVRFVAPGPLEWDDAEIVAKLRDLMETAPEAQSPQ